jgi:recombinational DNA repair ATPase RecF
VLVKYNANAWSGRMQLGGQVCAITHQCEEPLVRKQKNRRKKTQFIKALMAIKITREARKLFESRSARASRFLDGIKKRR